MFIICLVYVFILKMIVEELKFYRVLNSKKYFSVSILSFIDFSILGLLGLGVSYMFVGWFFRVYRSKFLLMIISWVCGYSSLIMINIKWNFFGGYRYDFININIFWEKENIFMEGWLVMIFIFNILLVIFFRF